MGFRALSSSMYLAQALAMQIAQDSIGAGAPARPGAALRVRRTAR